MQLKLSENVTIQTIENFGFVKITTNIFVYRRKLFRSSICVKISIDLKDQAIDYEVYDALNQRTYFPFYHNENGENNIVAIKVMKNFNDLVKELCIAKIISKENSVEND